jgi:mannosyl-3-phosphoglycerate phosphatase
MRKDFFVDVRRGENPVHRVSTNPFFIIFTDLDGSLLDQKTYGWEEARPALDLCKRLDIPVILVSSKTKAEMDPLRQRLSLAYPFISENGGGVFFPRDAFHEPPLGASPDKGLWKWSLGVPYSCLVKGIQELRGKLGWAIKGFSDMSTEEISSLTELDHASSRLAALREYDEPFIILEEQLPDKDALFKMVSEMGLQVIPGGRFYHLQGKIDKGQAMEKVVSWYRQSYGDVITIALGDSPNDFPMLERADYPILVRSKSDFPTLKKRIPRLKVTREMGPKGWNSAVLGILGKEEVTGDV